MIPLPVILVEFLVAFGLALFGANTFALVRLRRDGNWPPARDGGPGAGPPGDAGGPGGPGGPAPSAGRIVTGIVVGLVVTIWALGTWFAHNFSF